MTGSSELVHEHIREEIDALAARYELVDGAADALQGLVRAADWRQPNYVPKSDPSRSREVEKPRSIEQQRRLASNLLAESLSGLELEPLRTANRLADIGSGAGFPGLVLAIGLPEARVALIDKSGDTCRFLRRVTSELGLDNVEVVEGEVEGWSDGAGACDVITSRRLGRPNLIIGLFAPLLAPGGAVVLWQRRRDPAKENLAREAAEAAGLRLARVHTPKERRGKQNLYLYEKVDER